MNKTSSVIVLSLHRPTVTSKVILKVNFQSAEEYKSLLFHTRNNHIILAVISNDLTVSCSESFAWNLWIKFEIIISGLKATHVRWPGMTRSCSSWSVRKVGLDRWTSRPCPPHKPCCPTAPPSTTNLSVWFKQSFNLYLW